MNIDDFELKIRDYFANFTENDWELFKCQSNYEFYNSKIFKDIKLFSDDVEPVDYHLGEKVIINNIYDNDGNTVETDVVYEYTETGWRKVK